MRKKLLIPALALLCVGCGYKNKGGNNLADQASGRIDVYESSHVNAVEQARPTIMVIPSDLTLKEYGCLKTVTHSNGREYILRDYKSYLLKDKNAKQVISAIQNEFNKQNFPLNDFEQTLKQLDNQEAMDMVEGFAKDARTLLNSVARPDILLELTCSKPKANLAGHNYSAAKLVDYTLSAIDAYNNKVVATIAGNSVSGETTAIALQKDLNAQMGNFQGDILQYFSDILTRGRDITVRIALEEGCNINLTDESIEGDTYTDWIVDYIKSHTVKGAYNMQRNSDKELYFVNCRIRLLNDDGTQYGVYDWARDLQRNLRQNLGLKCTNKSQGLGEVVLSINGLM